MGIIFGGNGGIWQVCVVFIITNLRIYIRKKVLLWRKKKADAEKS